MVRDGFRRAANKLNYLNLGVNLGKSAKYKPPVVLILLVAGEGAKKSNAYYFWALCESDG